MVIINTHQPDNLTPDTIKPSNAFRAVYALQGLRVKACWKLTIHWLVLSRCRALGCPRRRITSSAAGIVTGKPSLSAIRGGCARAMTTLLTVEQHKQIECRQWRVCARVVLGKPELANQHPPAWFFTAWRKLSHPDPDIRKAASERVGITR